MNPWEVVDPGEDEWDKKTGMWSREVTYRNGKIIKYTYPSGGNWQEGTPIEKIPGIQAAEAGESAKIRAAWEKDQENAKPEIRSQPAGGRGLVLVDPKTGAVTQLPGSEAEGGEPATKIYQDGQGNTYTRNAQGGFERFGTQKGEGLDADPTPYQKQQIQIQQDAARLANEREERLAKAEELRRQSEAERDRINLLVQQGKLDSDNASERYKRWFNENVVVPFQTAQEERARSAEVREAQRQEFDQQKAAAEYEGARARSALSAGESAVKSTIDSQRYMVGSQFGPQFAEAVNGVARGDPKRVNFTADAFTYKTPDYEEIANKAVARALGIISPWAQQIQQAPVTQAATTTYSAPQPAPNFSTQPAMPAPIQLPPYQG